MDPDHAAGEQLPYLETFSKAAELSNFTAAGKALGMTQAAVSQRIHALEQALGVALFRRRGGRVLLTEAGQKLYDYAQRILDLHREARREVSGHETPVGGELLLAASSIPGEHLLPALLSLTVARTWTCGCCCRKSDSRAGSRCSPGMELAARRSSPPTGASWPLTSRRASRWRSRIRWA